MQSLTAEYFSKGWDGCDYDGHVCAFHANFILCSGEDSREKTGLRNPYPALDERLNLAQRC